MHPSVRSVTEITTSKKKRLHVYLFYWWCVLCDRGTAAFNGPTVHVPNDWWINIKTSHPGATLSTTNPTWAILILTQTFTVRCQLQAPRVTAHTRPVQLLYHYISADSREGSAQLPSKGPLIHSGSNTDFGWYVSQWRYCTSMYYIRNTML